MTQLGEFASRRQKLLSQLGKDAAAILFASSEQLRNGDVHFPFRQNSDFYYLTGFSETEAVAIFLPGRKDGQYILFNQVKDPQMERWLGSRVGQEGACQLYGADQSFDIGELDKKIAEILKDRKVLFYEIGKKKQWDRKITTWVAQLQAINRKNIPGLAQLSDISVITHEMRLIKSHQELNLMRAACEISAQAHHTLMEITRPGMSEFELEARFNYEVKVKGCAAIAYPTIVGSGSNACILHYVDNKEVLKDGELVLVDAGGEYENYAADITRTFPVNGKFSPQQKAIYELVLKAQLAVIQKIKPNVTWNHLQETAVSVLANGLVELGILTGCVAEVLESKSYQKYYMHNVGHWLGLDVHDAGAYKINGEWRTLKAGMVLTVEPGLYLFANDQLDPKWWGIGVRIEDDVLVTEQASEVLSHYVPKTVAEIESIMTRTTATPT